MGRQIGVLGMLLTALLLVGCSDSNNDNDGAAPPPPPPNTMDVAVDLDAASVVGGGAVAGSASATLTVNLDDDTVSGTVTLDGVTATAVNLNQGFAGENGPVLIAFEEASATEWSVTDVAFTQENLDALNAGALYLEVITDAEPGGALRGQFIVGEIKLYVTVLTGAQEVPPVTTTATATAATTVDPDTGALTIHVNAVGLDDAVAGHIHQALAGSNGPVLVELTQDPEDLGHWFAEDATLDADGLAALNAGALYVNLHTPANPPGELRGQIEPEGIEIVFTALTGGDVVPPVATANSGNAATTIDTTAQTFTMHVNLIGLDAALAVTVNQAPVGQNGPVVFTLAADANEMGRWSLLDQGLSEAQYMALRNQGLYVVAVSPTWPDGELRGQLLPEMSMAGGGDTLLVDAISPANGATVEALPGSIVATFNRDVLPSSVTIDSVEVLASGGDGAFGDPQDLVVAVADVAVTGAELSVDLTGATDMDDVYQVTLDGTSPAPISDTAGVVVDGDSDGNAGGDFVSTFTVAAPSTAPTLSDIQAQTFNGSCAVSGCHAGASPAQGLNLSAGQAHSNLVDVASAQAPGVDRVEPGDPDNSYLVQKIEGTAGAGGRMPLGQPALPNEQIQAIRDWILDGAQDN